jgi:hypothetical protein
MALPNPAELFPLHACRCSVERETQRVLCSSQSAITSNLSGASYGSRFDEIDFLLIFQAICGAFALPRAIDCHSRIVAQGPVSCKVVSVRR